MKFEIRHVRKSPGYNRSCLLCKELKEDLWYVKVNLETLIVDKYPWDAICCENCIGKYLKLLKPIEVQQKDNNRNIEIQLYDLQVKLGRTPEEE